MLIVIGTIVEWNIHEDCEMALMEPLRELSEKEEIARKEIIFEIFEIDIDPIEVMEIDECSKCIDEYSSSLIRREEFP